MVQVNWATPARQDLADIFRYYITCSQQTAITYVEELIKAGDRLKLMPEMGPKEPSLEIKNRNYRYVIVLRRYKLVYLYENNICSILMVWDCKRNPKDLKVSSRFTE